MGLTLTPAELESLLRRNPHLNVRGWQNQPSAPPKKPRFDSLAEELLYTRYIQPLVAAGKVIRCQEHPAFELLPAVNAGGTRYRERRYTLDFLLTWESGKVQAIEVKGKAVKKLQRDYPLRRQLFLLRYAVPQGWAFLEIPAEDITQGRLPNLSEP